MLRPIIATSLLLLVQQAAPLLQRLGTIRPVRDVTPSPRVAEIEFVDFEFKRPQPAHGGVFLFQIEGEPAAGLRYPVEASIAGERVIASARFDAIAEGGTLIQPLLIARLGTAVPGGSRFIGLMDVPHRPFRIRLTAQTVDGRTLQRLHPRLFRPGKGTLEIPPDAFIPPEYGGQRRLMDEEAKRLVAETESFVADATVPLVLPRSDISKVMYAPLLSAAGRPIGVRVTYDVEFSQAGEYNPQLMVYAEDVAGNVSGILAQMRVLNSSLEPLPRLAHAPDKEAGTNLQESVLAFGAHFRYEGRIIYHFTVDLIPGFMTPGRAGSVPCIWREGFRITRDPEKAFASMLARDGPSTYKVSLGGAAFEGRIEQFPGEGTLYRNLVADGAQDCS